MDRNYTEREKDESESLETGTGEANAEMEADADQSAQDATAALTSLNDRVPYIVELSKPYDFEGEIVKEIDLSGLEDLTTRDAEHFDRVMTKLNHHPKNKYRDTTYTKHIAMRLTGMPVEFFDQLRMKDMETVTSRIALYFLF